MATPSIEQSYTVDSSPDRAPGTGWLVPEQMFNGFIAYCNAVADNPSRLLPVFRNEEHIRWAYELEGEAPVGATAVGLNRYCERTKYPLAPFQAIDIGNPPEVRTVANVPISSTIMRFARMAYLARDWFTLNESSSVLEVGCGFGGQCAALRTVGVKGPYTLVDLPAVSRLQHAYLAHLGMDNINYCVAFRDNAIFEANKYSLFISAHALSEFDQETQNYYLSVAGRQCNGGIISWGQLRYHSTALELKRMIEKHAGVSPWFQASVEGTHEEYGLTILWSKDPGFKPDGCFNRGVFDKLPAADYGHTRDGEAGTISWLTAFLPRVCCRMIEMQGLDEPLTPSAYHVRRFWDVIPNVHPTAILEIPGDAAGVGCIHVATLAKYGHDVLKHLMSKVQILVVYHRGNRNAVENLLPTAAAGNFERVGDTRDSVAYFVRTSMLDTDRSFYFS